MKKVKLVGVRYNYDLVSDETIRECSEELDWTEISDQDYDRLRSAIPYKHRLGGKDPFYGLSIVILEDMTKTPLVLDEFLDQVDEVMRKDRVAAEKREEAARKAKGLKEQKAAERKRKMLEKLKAELEGASG